MSFKNPSVLWHLTWIPLLVTFAFFAAYKLRKRRLKSIIHDDDQLKKLTMNLSPVKRYARQLISLTIVILVLLTLAQPQWGEKTRVKDPVARLRLNAWRVTSVSVSAKGTFPNDQQGSL